MLWPIRQSQTKEGADKVMAKKQQAMGKNIKQTVIDPPQPANEPLANLPCAADDELPLAKAEPSASPPPTKAPFWRRMTAAQWVYWLLFFSILLGGAVLRSYRLDMPPFDYPEDRQRSYFQSIRALDEGVSLLELRKGWLELAIHPWITARTAWLCRIFHCELWTLARIWSMIFGMLTVALTAWAGWWGAATPGASAARRGRIALLFMAAVAFNPYHIKLSRMIITEPATLMFQVAALGFFWKLYRQGQRTELEPGAPAEETDRTSLKAMLPPKLAVPFIVLLMLSGWAKLPSLIWIPGYSLYFLFHHQIRLRMRLAALGIGALGVGAVFALYGLNPFTIFSDFARTYPQFAGEAAAWKHNVLWVSSFWGRTVYMLTLPVAFFALVGFLCAPWLFRITTVVFLVLFFQINNLNTYNFCHAMLPGAALAAWGVNALLEMSSGESWRLWGRGERYPVWQRWTQMAVGLVGVALLTWGLYPAGPDEIKEAVPRAEVLQSVRVLKQFVPQENKFAHNDILPVWEFFSDWGKDLPYSKGVELDSGWYYSVSRAGDMAIECAVRGWIKWANLPGEPSGILVTTQPPALPGRSSDYLSLAPLRLDQPAPFDLRRCLVPSEHFDAQQNAIVARPGDRVTIGLAWKNEQHAPVACMVWKSQEWQQYLPVPLREGGAAMGQLGLLCLADGTPDVLPYTIEIPQEFPVGAYQVLCYAKQNSKEITADKQIITLPFQMLVQAKEPVTLPLRRNFIELYLGNFDRAPSVWSNDWFYKDLYLQGYRNWERMSHYLSCPGAQAGVYELSIVGEAEPVTSKDEPDNVWPFVEVHLPGQEAPVARISLNTKETKRFTGTFTATAPFDSLQLVTQVVQGRGGEMPRWLINFVPKSYGNHVFVLRTAKLELHHETVRK